MRYFTLAAAFAALTTAAKLSVRIPASGALPNPATLPASTHAVLTGPPGIKHDAALRRDLSFEFQNLQPASYLLTIYAHEYMFPPLRVDVEKQSGSDSESITAWQTFRGNEWSNKGPQYGSAQQELVIQVQPQAQKDFYQVRGGFNILGFLQSPMILMALGSAVLIFGMPYLMENMDPEMKAEFEEMQKSSALTGSQGAAAQIQNFDLAGFLSGRSSEQASAPGQAGGSSGSNKKK